MIDEELASITRDGQRYGVFFLIAASNDHSIRIKLKQNFSTTLTLRFNDPTDYGMILGRVRVMPKDFPGRGVFKEKNAYEFQTATVTTAENINEYFKNIGIKLQQINAKSTAQKIPTLPEIVTLDLVKEHLNSLDNVPIGVYVDNLDIAKYNFTSNLLTPIISEKDNNITSFSKALVTELSQTKNTQLIVIDVNNSLEEIKSNIKYYYSQEPVKTVDMLINYIQQVNLADNISFKSVIYINDFSTFVSKVPEEQMVKLANLLKETHNISLIITDDQKGIKNLRFTNWYRNIQNESSGIWIGNGFAEQSIFNIFRIPSTFRNVTQNNYGFAIDEDGVHLFKTIEHSVRAGELHDK